jgi:hypothetical protein
VSFDCRYACLEFQIRFCVGTCEPLIDEACFSPPNLQLKLSWQHPDPCGAVNSHFRARNRYSQFSSSQVPLSLATVPKHSYS